MARKQPRVTVDVHAVTGDGTPIHDTLHARRATVKMSSAGRTVVTLTGGYDGDGPVDVAIYRHVDVIKRRPRRGAR
jgi:hypothetical protein